MWWRLNARRPVGEALQPLQFSEIQAFSEMSGNLICPDDLLLLETIDDAFLKAYNRELSAKQEAEREKAMSESQTKGRKRR
jgi:hypothetical protein